MIRIAYVAPNCPDSAGSPDLDAMVVVDDDIGRPHEIEGHNEQRKEWVNPHREEREDSQQPGCQVTVGGERGKASGNIRADDARKDKNKPEETEAVQSSDGALRFARVHRPESGHDVHAEAKQPSDIA